LLLPGSDDWYKPAHGAAVAKARDFLSAGVPVAAICGATVALARAGILDDRAHTSNGRAELAPTGYAGAARYVDAPAVTDRDLITASGIFPIDFARAIFERLDAYRADIIDAWFRLYKHGDTKAFADIPPPGAS